MIRKVHPSYFFFFWWAENKIYVTHSSYTYQLYKIDLFLTEFWGFLVLFYDARLVEITHIIWHPFRYTKAAYDTRESLKILSKQFCNKIPLIAIQNSFNVKDHLIFHTGIDDLLLIKCISFRLRLMLSSCLQSWFTGIW